MSAEVIRPLRNKDINAINWALDKYVCPYAEQQTTFESVNIVRLSRGAGIVVASELEEYSETEIKSIDKILSKTKDRRRRHLRDDFVVTLRDNLVYPSIAKQEIDPEEVVEHHLQMHVYRDTLLRNMLTGSVNKNLSDLGINALRPDPVPFLSQESLIIEASTNTVMKNFGEINRLAEIVSRKVGLTVLGPLSLVVR